MVFPPYGRSKGAPIAGASIQDLEFYINGSRRSLDDPSKARWHEKERVLLAALEAELARQRGGVAVAGTTPNAAPNRRTTTPRAFGRRHPVLTTAQRSKRALHRGFNTVSTIRGSCFAFKNELKWSHQGRGR